METENAQSPEEIELKNAQARLEAAHQKKAQADELKLASARAAILQRESDEIENRRKSQEAYEAQVAKVLAKRTAEEDAYKAACQAADNERKAMERNLSELEADKQKREAHARRVKHLSEEAHRIEQEAAQATAEALRGELPVEEAEQITLQSEKHPLHFILDAGQERVATAEPEIISQDTILPVERPKCSPEDYEQLAQLWFNTSGVKITNLQSQILQLYDLSTILSAVEQVVRDGRFRFRDLQHSAVVMVLSGASLDDFFKRLEVEKVEKETRAKDELDADYKARH